MPKPETHRWEFQTRFRRHAFGWKSQPAVTRVRQAVAEIKKIAKRDAMLAAEGAVLFLERVSPALEQVDSSSGAIGSAVNTAIADLVPLIVSAPADATTRNSWLERLFNAHEADQIPYIERLADDWGALCASQQVASLWADCLLGLTRTVLGPEQGQRVHFHGTAACLGALYHAGRFDEIGELLHGENRWSYRQWAVRALAAKGQKAEALLLAESGRGRWTSDSEVDATCEEILLSSGLRDEAYARYGVRANQGGTYLATFRAVARKYPERPAGTILADLVKTTPGDEGKWFAAAKDVGLYAEALTLASRSPCDPKTLTRAARDFAETEPAFAVGAGLAALHWLIKGYGYEVTGADVYSAYFATLTAAERQGRTTEVKERIRNRVASEDTNEGFVRKVLGRELGL